ncbi:MAG TPA: hypothetical protein VKB51_00060 [bacterium]|nr:hypothetical protein [bacterium]
MAAILGQGVQLAPERLQMLREGLEKGREFFDHFNESRLKLAFSSFDEEMKKALYEVLFLIHVNDPKFADLPYQAIELERKGGVVRYKPKEAVADLYVEGAPCGVEGLGRLSDTFRDALADHIRETFGMEVPPTSSYGYCPVKSVHSLGSIGTIGHKSRASDLDLQVQYELEPFYFDTSSWSDQTFREALTAEGRYWMNRLRVQMKLTPAALQDEKVKADLNKRAMQQLAKSYPRLYRYLIGKQGDYAKELVGEQGAAQRTQTLHEVMALMKRSVKVTHGEEMKQQETLLQQRLKRIQDYIASKYPMAEIYLFACSNDDYRIGHHGSTLVSKEASGSAYELILNYETLMPGIQITPMMPTHFILPQVINDDPALYDRIIDYIRFGQIDLYQADQDRLVNLGSTPDLGLEYVAKHSGAVYWEAFKASSGNLPKAILNLFRIETLLDKRFLKTIIQTIKDPEFMHQYAAPKPDDPEAELAKSEIAGVPPWALIDLEETFPLLKQDPWWLRYKALKIAYHEENGVKDIDQEERARISKVIDLAFALHVRISDVFTKPGDTRPFDTHREQVLLEFHRRAFPPGSPRRKFLEHLFVGEVHSVYEFERELRELFKACLARVNRKIAALKIPGETNQKEFEIWYHYYQENFEPAPNVIQKTILKHLTVPRSRIQMGNVIGQGWFFKSLQKQSSVGKRFDTFGYLDHLPEEVMLRERSSFLTGLAESIVNGYYGVINQGTLKETATVIEFDPKAMDLGNRIDNTMAFLRPDNVHRILARIIEFFPYRPYHYMDCIEKKREVVELLIFLNVSKFGRLSFLYRDNLQTWYLDEVDHADLFANAQNLHQSPRGLFTARPLHVTLARFFKAKGINLGTVSLGAWVNPNSVATSHSLRQAANTEAELAKALLTIVRQVHGPKEPPPEAEPPPEEPAPEADA